MAKVIKGPWASRQAVTPLFMALAFDLVQMPSPGQENLITSLVDEIGQLSAKLGEGRPNDSAAWLRGFIIRVDINLWAPANSQAWQRVIAALKARKKQHLAALRKKGGITPGQIRAVWAAVRSQPGLDKDLLYEIIGRDYPQARKGQGKKARPSLSSLTSFEASRLLDDLNGARRRA
jgi:hypothetical protein